MTQHTNTPDSRSELAAFIDKRIDQLQGRKSQKDIADEVGYDKPNMISMIKKGTAKVPLEKVYLFAKALEVDPAHLLRLALAQSMTGEKNAIAIQKIVGNTVTDNEMAIVKVVRKASGNMDPALNQELKTAIEELFIKFAK